MDRSLAQPKAGRRYTSPRVISTHAVMSLLPGRMAALITEVALETSRTQPG
jgi:hypothetical protein